MLKLSITAADPAVEAVIETARKFSSDPYTQKDVLETAVRWLAQFSGRWESGAVSKISSRPKVTLGFDSDQETVLPAQNC